MDDALNRTEIRGYCTLCRSRCGTINTLRGGKLYSVAHDSAHPTGRATCPKGRAAPEIVHSPDRLLYPMKRTRPKGDADPGWQRISWDEALDTISENLIRIATESGPEVVAFEVTTPSGTPISDSIDWIERFIRLYGSPNTIYGTEICNWHKDVAHAFTFGCGMPAADYAHARLNLLWGHNPSNVWLSQAGKVADGVDGAAKLLVIDPRETAHARQADVWLRVRPGTDAALALGLVRWMIRNKAFDAEFVRQWTNGPLLVDSATGGYLRASDFDPSALGFAFFDTASGTVEPSDPTSPKRRLPASAALAGTVQLTRTDGRRIEARPTFELLREACEPFDPARVERETGIAPADLERAAGLIAEAGPNIAYHSWTGIGQQLNATQTERAAAVLYALTGSFDQVGGNRIYVPPAQSKINPFDLLTESQRAKALGLDERPLGPPATGWVLAKDVYRAILDARPYKVRALFGFGGNLLVSHPGARNGERALSELEFHVHCDLFHTPTNAYADILLPASSPWEHEGLRVGFEIDEIAAGHVQLRPQMVERRGEARPDYEIVLDLACRMGMADQFFGGRVEEGWNHILAPSGLDVEMLRAHPGGMAIPVDAMPRKYEQNAANGVKPFATPSGLVELYSERLLQHGYSPVPIHVPPRAGTGRHPLTMITPKNGVFCHSQHRNLPSLRRRALEPTICIHPALAQRRGLADGELCAISTALGEVRMRVTLAESLDETVVSAEYGWWQSCPDLGLPSFPILGRSSANINGIVDDVEVDPVSGSLPLRSIPCDVRPYSNGEVARWRGWRHFVVAGIEAEGAHARSITLQPADGKPLPSFQPGQHVVIRHTQDVERTRSYSLSGPRQSDQQHQYRITVKRQVSCDETGLERVGFVSDHLNRRLLPGDGLWLQAPSGRFVLPLVHSQPIVLIAAGIGITPFIGYLETLATRRATHPDVPMPETILLYGSRNGRDHPFRDRIRALAHELDRLRVINLYSRPEPGDQRGIDFDRAGRINAALIDDDWIVRRARFFLCGPSAMMREMRTGLEARQVLPFEIHLETFASPLRVLPDADARHRIEFRRSGVVLEWTPAAGSVLDLATRSGVTMASGCRVGQCESCALRLLAGRAMQPDGLPEMEDGVFLACQMIPMSDIVVDA